MRFRFPLLLLAALAACADDPTGSKVAPSPEAPRALGLVEITFSRLGTGEMSATVTPAGLAGGASRSVSAVPGAVPGGSVQLGLRSTSTVDAAGDRYLQAVFRVRNAMGNGTPNARALRNVTFIPVSTPQTIPGTPVLRFLKQDGSPADPALAAQLRPTGAVADNGSGGVAAQYPDVLQAYTEDEVAAIDMSSAPSVTNRFPYGFVTRRVDNTATRDLPPSPAPEQFDGAVTFAYRFPTRSSAANNPFTITILALAVEDDVTRITQSVEEQGAGQAAFEARAASLAASEARILTGGGYNGAIPRVAVCSVRTAGTRESPTTFVGSPGDAFLALSPNPYSGAGSFIARDAELSATFDGNVSGAGPGTFAVHTFQSAGTFLNGSYSGNGTSTLAYRHAGRFFPNEEVEVSLTGGITCTPRVARLRVASAPASGRFVAEAFGGIPATELTAADLNGDGHVDVVGAGGTSIGSLLGDGTGRFGSAAVYPVNGGAVALALGDVNRDGKLDAVTANSTTNSVSVALGDGKGGFPTRTHMAIGTSPVSIALGDVDGDGDLDMVTANNAAHNVSVLLGNGAGGFSGPVRYTTGANPRKVVLGDVSGDGILDVVTSDRISGDVSVLRGNGAGGFSAPTQYAGSSGTVALGDLNGDSRLDIVPTRGRVLLANGSGGFTQGGTLEGGNALVLGDMNRDGKLDAVVSGPSAGTTRVALGDGSGGFASITAFPAGTPATLALADANEDGALDLLASSGSGVRVVLGDGSGGLVLPPQIGSTARALGDLNGDGATDVLPADEGPALLGDGSGGFSRGSARVTYPPGTVSLRLADMNNDGRLDIVTANSERNLASVQYGDGSGGFSAAVSFPANRFVQSVAAGDLNADGWLDLVVTNLSQDDISVLLADGGGGFLAPVRYPQPTPDVSSVSLSDLNNDGRLDIVSSRGRVLLGNGRGGFTTAPSFVANGNSVELGDLNGDGRQDVVYTLRTVTGLFQALGNGDGTFGAATQVGVGGPVQLGDLNGDGQLDIVGTGGRGFLGDLNNDGRLDILSGTSLLFNGPP